jgi:hypothetical protein
LEIRSDPDNSAAAGLKIALRVTGMQNACFFLGGAEAKQSVCKGDFI